VEPRVYERDGFVVTLWTYYEPVTTEVVSPADWTVPALVDTGVAARFVGSFIDGFDTP
jgi:hypothetical protein